VGEFFPIAQKTGDELFVVLPTRSTLDELVTTEEEALSLSYRQTSKLQDS